MSLPSIPHRRRRFTGRDPEEAHRAATPLELLYDLTIVVAFGVAADELAHFVADDHIGAGIIGFLFACFAVSWAWLQYTWFASAYDTDDWVFRLATLVQMAGVLVIALGIHDVFASIDKGDKFDNTVVVSGYVVMRLSLLALWWGVARHDDARRKTALFYLRWIGVLQIGWIAQAVLSLPVGTALACGAVLVLLECAGPFVAERSGNDGGTPWHPHHVAERYGLLLIITLGEGIIGTIASLNAVVHAEEGWTTGAVLVLASGLGITFASWWMYFAVPWGELLTRRRDRGFAFGYGHLVMFAGLAGVGGGLHVAAYQLEDKAHVSDTIVVLSTVVPFLVFALAFYAVYSTVMLTFDPFHVALLLGTLGFCAAAIVAVGVGASVPVALMIVVGAPVVTVVGYELLGHRHMAEAVERL